MTELFDSLARTGNRPMLARSLYFWHQILGEACGAEPLLRRMAGEIIRMPVGADIAEQHVDVRSVPDGFDIQEAALPGADALFAYVSEPGLRLVVSSQKDGAGRVCRRLRVCRADGSPFLRHGPERFMLRYRLDPAIIRARDILVLQLTLETGPQATGLPPLHPWIEIHHGGDRHYVETIETSAGMLGNGEAIRLAAFAPSALAEATSGMQERLGLYFYLELTGEIIDVNLMGETLIT